MNKRITGLAVLMLLLMSAGAWAAASVTITTTGLSPSTIYCGTQYEYTIEATSNNVGDGATLKYAMDFGTSPLKSESAIIDEDSGKITLTPVNVGTVKITVTATVTSSDGETTLATTKKTFSLTSVAYKPATITIGENGEDPEDMNLGLLVQATTGALTSADELTKDASAIVFKSKATLPITFEAKGLPTGYKAELKAPEENKATADGKSADIEIVITGKPTKSGLYNNIVLNIKNSAGTTASSTYNMRVFDKATVTTKSLPNMTWGKNYSTKLAFTGGLTGYPVSFDTTITTADTLKTLGLSFDYETGQLFTEDDPYTKNDKATTDDMKFEDSKTKSMDLTFKVLSPAGSGADSETYTLPITVVAVPPKILSKDEMVSLFETAIAGLDIKSADGTLTGSIAALSATAANEFYAVGPGNFTWTIKNLPAGFTSGDASTYAETYNTGKTIIVDDSATAVKVLVRHPITVTVSNPSGSDSVTVYANLGTGFAFTDASATAVANIAGVHNLSHDIDATPITADSTALPAKKADRKLPTTKKVTGLTLAAFPGPVTWTAKNLPSGLKLSIDKSKPYDTTVIISGDYKAATKKNQHFTITATNKLLGISKTLSGDVTVYAPPKITGSSLPVLTIGKNYTAKIAVNGIDVSVDVDFVASGDTVVSTTEALPARKGEITYGTKTYPATITTAGLTFDPDKMTITGSLDAWPENKNILQVTVTAKNPGYTEASASEANGKGAYTQKVLNIAIKAVPPKIATSRIADFDGTDTDGSKHQVTITGLPAPTIEAYIGKAAAGALGFNDGTASYDVALTEAQTSTGALPATKRDGETPTLTGTYKTKGETMTINLIGTPNGYAITAIPLTISANNGQGKPVVKAYKFAFKGLPPILVSTDQTSFTSRDVLSRDVVFNAVAGKAFTLTNIKVSGDKPYTYQSSIGMGGSGRNGITVTSADGVLTISGTPTAGKETKTQITITALNTSTKQKFTRKFTIVGAMAPVITTAAAKLKVETEVGKRLVFTPTARGTKPIVWGIDTTDSDAITSQDLKDIGLDFNENTGQIIGVPHTPTSDDSDQSYKPYTVKIWAGNSAGSADADGNPNTVTVTIGVKGRKPKFAAQTIKYEIGSTPEDGAMILKSDIPATDMKSNVQWALNSTTHNALKGKIAVATASDTTNYRNMGEVTPDDLDTATKGATFKISMDNVGNTVLGNVKIIVTDPKPVVTSDPSETLEITANKTSAKTGKVVFSIADQYKTGDTGIKWAINTKPSNKVTAAIKAASNGKSATVTVTVPKGVTSRDVPSSSTDGLIHTTFSVTATNTVTKEVGDCSIEVVVTPYDGARAALPAQKDALPEDKSEEAEEAETETEEEAEEEAEEEETEGTVSYGEPRTAETLTAEESSALAEAGYIVAAILPEVTADADGLYDLEAVTLAENVPAGEALVWFAFPRNAEKSDDDTIAEFYDEAGAEITAVPETKTVIVSPWLRKDVTYAPVIAVKAPVTSDTKDSLDEATEGDTVTEQAIEEAAEVSADEAPAETTEAPAEETPAEK